MKTVIVANPTSGHFNEPLLNRCADLLQSRFGDVTIEYTTKPNEAGAIAVKSGANMVIAAGGDGLINETAGGLVDKDILFTALPFGTVNVFCREFDIPLNPVKAASRINPVKTKKIPIGFLGRHPFVLMCGFGYDAHVVKQVVSKGYNKNKTFAHCLEGISSFNVRYPELALYVNGRVVTAYHIIISLGQRYAGSFSLSNIIKNDVLNIFIQRDNRLQALLYATLSIAVGGGFPSAPIYAGVAKIAGTSHCQLDGEYINTGSMQNYVSIKRSAITITL